MSKDVDPPVSKSPFPQDDPEQAGMWAPPVRLVPDLTPKLAVPRQVRLSPDGYRLAVEYDLPGYISRTSVRWLVWSVQDDGQIVNVGLLGPDDVAGWTDWEQR